VEFRSKYTWQPAKGQGSVSGHVFFQEIACVPTGDLVLGCPGGGPCVDGVCKFPAANVQVTILGGDNNSVITSLDGSYTFPSVRAGTFEVSAYSQRDYVGELLPYGAQIQVTVPSQGSLENQDLTLVRRADPRDRIVTLTGDVRLIDCDCLSEAEEKTRHFELSCRVNPSDPTNGLTQLYCADEVGLKLDGTCFLQDDDSVRVNIQGILLESTSDTCGGTDVEDRTVRRDIIIQPDAAQAEPYNESRLINKTRCAFRQCDDKAFFRNLLFYNKMAPF
jgi:hypothetical protein